MKSMELLMQLVLKHDDPAGPLLTSAQSIRLLVVNNCLLSSTNIVNHCAVCYKVMVGEPITEYLCLNECQPNVYLLGRLFDMSFTSPAAMLE